ncbi:hypothetical protein BLOT_015287 [Blomia tropicalis]|nr:hypothetical protein BLOT_015287 [Blomia tropicalis]
MVGLKKEQPKWQRTSTSGAMSLNGHHHHHHHRGISSRHRVDHSSICQPFARMIAIKKMMKEEKNQVLQLWFDLLLYLFD